MKDIINIIKPSTILSKKNDGTIDTELLFGEDVKVLNESKNHFLCKSIIDNYKGWIRKRDVDYLPKPTHKINNIRTFVYEKSDIKSKVVSYLPFGSKINITKISDTWSKLNLMKKSNLYIPSINLCKINSFVIDWVKTAEMFINIPYKWGGRDSWGIDCSALVQLSLQSSGIIFPRDTVDQKKIDWKIINNSSCLKRGMLIFWKGHVGIMLDEKYLIHANSTSMNVIIEKLSTVITRHEKNDVGDIEVILERVNQRKFL